MTIRLRTALPGGKMGRREGEGSTGFVNGQVYEDELIMGMTG